MYFVYVLQNPAGKFYIGQTNSLERRLSEHNSPREKGCGKFTLKNGPWTLAWHEEHPDQSSAIRRERQIKSMKSARWIREHLLTGTSR